MAQTFADMQDEVFARGFQFHDDGGAGLARVKRWINESRGQLNGEARWEYLRGSASITAGGSIADLGTVENVRLPDSNDRPLTEIDSSSLFSMVSDDVAEPLYWYREGDVVNVWPVPSTLPALTVRYLKVESDLVADGDEPLVPDRYRPAIIELAVAKAYRDISAYADAAACRQEYDRIVAVMRADRDVLQLPRAMTYRPSALDD